MDEARLTEQKLLICYSSVFMAYCTFLNLQLEVASRTEILEGKIESRIDYYLQYLNT